MKNIADLFISETDNKYIQDLFKDIKVDGTKVINREIDIYEFTSFDNLTNYLIYKIYETKIEEIENDILREYIRENIIANALGSRIDVDKELVNEKLEEDGKDINTISDNDYHILEDLGII